MKVGDGTSWWRSPVAPRTNPRANTLLPPPTGLRVWEVIVRRGSDGVGDTGTRAARRRRQQQTRTLPSKQRFLQLQRRQTRTREPPCLLRWPPAPAAAAAPPWLATDNQLPRPPSPAERRTNHGKPSHPCQPPPPPSLLAAAIGSCSLLVRSAPRPAGAAAAVKGALAARRAAAQSDRHDVREQNYSRTTV